MLEGLAKYVGRDYEKCNCFDLVKQFYLDKYDISLRNYWEGDYTPERSQAQKLIISGKGDFEKVTEPKLGDIIVVNLFGYSCHVGIYVGHKQILHSIRKVGSCIEPIKKYERMVEGYYRHKVLA